MKLRFLTMLSFLFATFSSQSQILYRKFEKDLKAKYYIEKIIDARIDTSTFAGLAIDTVAKTIQVISFEKPIANSLKELLNFAIDKDETAFPLVLKINYLEYGRRQTKKDENGLWIYVDIDLFIRRENSYFKIGSEQRTFEGIKPVGIDGIDFPNLTWNTFKNILKDYIYKKSLNLIDINVFNEFTISNKKVPLPIFTTDRFVDGIYFTYQEFLMSNPSYRVSEVTTLRWHNWGMHFIDSDGKEKKIKRNLNIWGIVYKGYPFYAFDNKELGYSYIPVQPLGTIIEAAGIVPKLYDNKLLQNYKWLNSEFIKKEKDVSYTFYSDNSAQFLILDFTIMRGTTFEFVLWGRSHRFVMNDKTGELEKVPFIDLSR